MPSIRSYSPTSCAARPLVALIVITGLAAGCGKAPNEVVRLSGEVSLDGKPLSQDASGSVTFRPIGEVGRPVSAPVIQGHYECADVPKGEVLAVVNISVPTGRTLQGDLRTGESGSEFESVVLSPDQASGIKLEVTNDATVSFELTRDNK